MMTKFKKGDLVEINLMFDKDFFGAYKYKIKSSKRKDLFVTINKLNENIIGVIIKNVFKHPFYSKQSEIQKYCYKHKIHWALILINNELLIVDTRRLKEMKQ